MSIKTLLLASLISLVAFITAPAHGGIVIQLAPTVTFDLVDSTYDYEYVLTNPPENTVDGDLYVFADFSIDVPATADLTTFLVPSGWFLTYSPGDLLVEWSSDDLPNNVVPPGASLTFGFSSPLAPGDTGFMVISFLSQNGDLLPHDDSFYTEVTQGPISLSDNAVPEPSGLAVFASIASLFALGTRLRRQRSSSLFMAPPPSETD